MRRAVAAAVVVVSLAWGAAGVDVSGLNIPAGTVVKPMKIKAPNPADIEGGGNIAGAIGSFAKLLSGAVAQHGDNGCGADVCPEGTRPVPREGHVPWSNGCGSYGVSVDTEGFSVTPCCDEHDECYSTCGQPRKMCDMRFASCMQAVCNTLKKQYADKCKNVSTMYSLATSTLGCATYEESQKEACKCVPDDGAAAAKGTKKDKKRKGKKKRKKKRDRNDL